jgi:hypothetical protein
MGKPFGVIPSPGIRNQVLDRGPKISYSFSGEITSSKSGTPIFAPDFAGKVADVHLCLANGGKDDDETLAIEGDLLIGGTSVFTTKPKITHVSGESAAARSTFETDDGIQSCVIDHDNNDFSAGDVFMFNYALTRTASPTTEINNLVVLVDLVAD